ncbi:uncharacterized protein LOC143057534 [Mytilus galloprovincialis]|uniref:uncharacterized protein LOC143057534 n=1 Tax=Mytilus galloprovincialis TaxID=29158 RepID=UPI003F7BAA0D
MGTGWKLYYTNDEYIDERSGRCPSTDEFMYYKRLDLCFNLNSPMTINFPVIKTFCSHMSAELIRIDSSDKQQFIEFITANETIERICIQGTDKIFPPNWTFDDGTLMTFFNEDEASAEPDGGKGNIEMYTGYKWHDISDVTLHPCLPICEII